MDAGVEKMTHGLTPLAEEEVVYSVHGHEYRGKLDDGQLAAQQCHPFHRQGMGRHFNH